MYYLQVLQGGSVMFRFIKQKPFDDEAEVVMTMGEREFLDVLLEKFRLFLIASGYDMKEVTHLVAIKKDNKLINEVTEQWEKDND